MKGDLRTLLLALLSLAMASNAAAQPAEGSGAFAWEDVDALPAGSSESSVDEVPHDGRASSRVDRDSMARRLPRSAPDALRYEPGVYIQQTAQSQASPYIRGRTGQQTVLLFDGVRLNNSLFRQGPNQYFFTIDSATVDHIDVLRGSASTHYGSDAIAGAIEAVPISAQLTPPPGSIAIAPRYIAGYDSSSDAHSQRLQVAADAAAGVAVMAGVGYRDFGLLRSGGPVRSPTTNELPEVPRFDTDNRTQLGTGFEELTVDGRVEVDLTSSLRLTAAAYNYRQTDAPRTDQCAPPFAPFDECLTYDEQFRTVAYAGLDGDAGPLRDLQVRLSWQRQHERRTHERPSSFTVNGGRDDVDTFGVRAVAETPTLGLGGWGDLTFAYGGDLYHDRVESTAWLQFTDLDITRFRSRGQYLDGSTYTWGGVFSQTNLEIAERVRIRAGGRLAGAGANAPGDPESETAAIDAVWTAGVGNVGAEWWVTDWLTLLVGADQGFRAPNLDDLTSRQRTGPGYQLENPDLIAERALTVEGGVRVRHPWVSIDFWAYRMTLDHAISRASRSADDCPTGNNDCRNAWNILQLINVDGAAVIRGFESTLRVETPDWSDLDLWAQSTLSWARGDEPKPSGEGGRQPVSRVPPLNGTVELGYEHASGLWLGGAARWANLQDRLSVGDVSDARIPRGGTPGYAVFDLRAGYRLSPFFATAVIVENLGDAAYRTHGSSVNGPGRSVLLHFEFGFDTSHTP